MLRVFPDLDNGLARPEAWPGRRRALGWSLAILLLVGGPSAFVRADEAVPFARVAPLFQKHCHGCHGPAQAKGKLRIDKLSPDFVNGKDADHWREVLDRLNFGDMPPAKQPAVKKE